MPSVPLEIEILVIEWIYMPADARRDVDYTTLRACALVCRAWTRIAQSFIFRRIPYRGDWSVYGSTALLLRTLQTEPHIAALVRFIDVELLLWPAGVLAARPADIVLLELCHDVHGVFVTQARPAPRQNVWERPKDTVDALQTIPPHPVFLHVTGRPAFVRNVLRVWPNVCTLSAVICGDDAISSIIPAPHVLQSLFVGPEDLGGFRPQEFPALRTLELSHASRMNRHLRASSLLPQIRTLSVPGLPPSQDVLGALRQLESLVFGDLPIAMSLPQTLRHVGYHEPFGYRSPEQNSEVFLQALCELENLHLVTCTVCSTAALREALHEQCHARRVDFVVYMHASCAPGVRTPEYYPTGALGLPWLAKFSAPRNV